MIYLCSDVLKSVVEGRGEGVSWQPTSTCVRLLWYFPDTLKRMLSLCLCWLCTAKGLKVISVKLDLCDALLRWTEKPTCSWPLTPPSPPPGYVGWRFLTLLFCPPLPDPAPRWRGPHPRRQGHRGTEAFPRPLGSLFQATAGEGGEAVWGEVPGKSFLSVFDIWCFGLVN